MKKIKEQQDGVVGEAHAEPEERKTEVHRPRGYKSQRELEEINCELQEINESLKQEVAVLEEERDARSEEHERLSAELEEARRTITALVQRKNQAETFELDYRRKADRLGAQLQAALQAAFQRSGTGSGAESTEKESRSARGQGINSS